MAMTETTASTAAGSWRELLGREYIGATTVLAGGVAIYAINEFITMSLLPSAVADIGGERLYAWVTTVYLVASVMAATTVGPVLTRFGPRASYLGALMLLRARQRAVHAGADDAAASGRPGRAGTGRRLAGRAGLCGDQRGAAGPVVDPGVGRGVGDVGDRHTGRSRHGWFVRPIRLLAWGIRCSGCPRRGDVCCWFRSLCRRAPTAGDELAAVRIPVRSLLLLGVAALAVSVAAIPRNAGGHSGAAGARRGAWSWRSSSSTAASSLRCCRAAHFSRAR